MNQMDWTATKITISVLTRAITCNTISINKRRGRGLLQIGFTPERACMVRAACEDYLEPALESCMKVQRIPALTVLS